MTYQREAWRASVTNGKIPRRKLRQIVPTQYDPDLQGPAILHPEAAASMSDLLATVYAKGFKELRVKYSYRTLAKQQEKWENYLNGGNLAALPGTSNHGWAVAVDFTGLTSRALFWLRTNADRFGWVNDVPSENWHYTYQGGYEPEEEMTDEQLQKLRDSDQRWNGFLGYLAQPDPDAPPPRTRPAAFKEGWNAARKVARRPRV